MSSDRKFEAKKPYKKGHKNLGGRKPGVPDGKGYGGLIPTAPAVDSFWDSQIRESLTRCWLLRGAASKGAAVSITRLDVTAAALRMAADREKDGSAAANAGYRDDSRRDGS
jgi:hypothetical protein